MKKIFALIVVALTGLAASFAFDTAGIEGSWKDGNWDALYTIGADTNGKGALKITKASTGKVVWTFNDSNISDFQKGVSSDGAWFSFYCKGTGRKYKFTKPISLGTSLNLSIDRDWTDEPYEVTITWSKGDAGIDGKSVVEGTKAAVETTKNLAEDVSNFANSFSEK